MLCFLIILYAPLIRTYKSLIFVVHGAIHYVWWIRRGGCRVRTERGLGTMFDKFHTRIRGQGKGRNFLPVRPQESNRALMWSLCDLGSSHFAHTQ